jgi:RNA polymerase sigma-70 factor, ECF subfamily
MEDELRALWLAGLDGDAGAYRRFLVALTPRLRRYFRRRLQAMPDDVEDLLQETLLAIHQQRHTYRRQELLTPWVHAVARYKLVDWWRARGRRVQATESMDELADVLSDPEVAVQDTRRDLHQLVAQLPANQRLPIEHTKLQGLTVAESAALTGLSESAIKVGVHRGIKALARLWKEQS